MPKAVDLSTAGIKVGYGIEETAGTKPTKFINIPNPKSIPDTNPEPSTYDVTSLNDTTWKRYIQGLKDIGGALAITFGMSQVFLDSWDDICTKYEEGIATGKRMWMEFYHPKLDKAFFFTCEPDCLGFPAAEVDGAWDGNVNVTPTGEIGWAEAVEPTDAAA